VEELIKYIDEEIKRLQSGLYDKPRDEIIYINGKIYAYDNIRAKLRKVDK
jgi:hypothetical protein